MSLPAQEHRPRVLLQRGAALILVLMIGIAAGCSPAALGQQSRAGGASSGNLEVVMAGKPTRKTLTLVTTQPARLEALEQAPLHSKLAAYVGEVLVDFGDRVKKGQPLVKLSAPEMDAEVKQKEALLAQTRAELLQSEAGVRAAEAAVVTARAHVAQVEAGTARAQADVDRWRSEFARLDKLAASGSINRQLVDETQQKLGAAEAALKENTAAIQAAQAQVLQAQAEQAKSASDVEAARSRVQVAESNVAQVQALRSYLTLTAPFDGVITQRQVDPGHFVQPGSGNGTPLLVVARSDKMRIFAAVPEVEAGYVDLDDVVTLEVPSLRGPEIQGKVTRTGFALHPGSRSLDTIIDIDNADGRLRPGLYAMAKIILHQQKDALALPAAAVVRDGKEAFCFRLIHGTASKTPIQVGMKVADDFEIISGVSESDTVILNKASSLKDGQRVDVLDSTGKK